MYPDRQSVERLEEDAGQDQARLAARGLPDAEQLAGEEPGTEVGTDEEKLQNSDEQG